MVSENNDYSTPRLLSLDDITEGQVLTGTVAMTIDLVENFIRLTEDRALVHVDTTHAQRMGFVDCIVHGFLVSSGYSRLLGMFLPGSNTVIQKIQLDMLGPVFVGDIITYEVKVDRVIPAVKSVQLKLSASNQSGQVVNKGITVCTFLL